MGHPKDGIAALSLLFLFCIFLCLYHPGNNPSEEGLKKIPNPYYISTPWPDHSAYGLELAIGKGFNTPYQTGVFDCSNMASFLQWKLKKLGFDAKICMSNDFKGFDHNVGSGHAWVAVDVPVDGKKERFYVESTANEINGFNFQLIKSFDADVKYYSDYQRIYDDIHELAKHEPFSEYDWWTRLNYSIESKIR